MIALKQGFNHHVETFRTIDDRSHVKREQGEVLQYFSLLSLHIWFFPPD